jgi:integrase
MTRNLVGPDRGPGLSERARHASRRTDVTHRFHKLLKRSGLPPMRFHDLRHACASLLLVQGVHPRVVMVTLGHSQISLTMNTFSHVLPALQREAADKMEAALTSSA